jgi:hypothetical protein
LRRFNVLSLFILLAVLVISGCNKKTEEQNRSSGSGEFIWKENLTASDIPDFPVKAFLNGKAVQINYIVFEVWRGSNDNVLNFSLIKPEQQCGFIQNYQGFQLFSKGAKMNRGEWSRTKFDDNPGNHQAFYSFIISDSTSYKSDCDWNCSLEIDNISHKIVSGKIAICFNDKYKSWIAGRFEAAVCNN